MKFRFYETRMLAKVDNECDEKNSYVIIAKNDAVPNVEMEKLIKIIDESGKELNCTYDKFVEIFDREGLAGFVM